MGSRQTFGLFISPIHASTGMGIATISFALAIGQFCWGVSQPVAGAMADRWGPRPTLIAGIAVLSLACALTPLVHGGLGLSIVLGVLASLGSGAASFSVLIGAASQRIPPHARGAASGIINAGGSFGQFVFAPIAQLLIQSIGWMTSMWMMAATVLAALPFVGLLTSGQTHYRHAAEASSGLGRAVTGSLRNPSYLLLHAGFFTCGFHIAFLVTHLPGEVHLCGLPPSVASWSLAIIGLANIFGSVCAGAWVATHRSKYVLACMYGSRALLIAVYLMMPRTQLTYYLFAAGLGFTWLATVPPTATIVGKLFGTRYLSTLFGMTLVTHQIGAFLGAWLGGLAITRFGNYSWMWYADMTLAAVAALVNLPIDEAVIARPAAQPA
jgi:predicted MFS family arabinose efflux permease